jgi:hypothetical protein
MVPEAALRGRVTLHLPYVGRWSNWLRQGHNFYYLLWPPAALIIAGELLSIYRQVRSHSEAPSSLEDISPPARKIYRPLNFAQDQTGAMTQEEIVAFLRRRL